jgi:hypothetical protein
MEALGPWGDVIVTVLFLGSWFALMRFVLPKLGIST